MRWQLLKCGGWLLGASLVAMGSGLQAQQTQDDTGETQSEQENEGIVVTGTLLGQREFGATPINVISREDIETQPRSSVGELLNLVPAFAGSAVFTDAQANGQSGAATINLRGLGPRATLVLLNGRRIVDSAEANNANTVAVDVSTILPAIMIERLEVLKDGASATYGADAVAGVVNFITRDDFEGVALDVTHNNLDGVSHEETVIGAIIGQRFGDVHFVAAADYMNRTSFDFRGYNEVDEFLTQNNFENGSLSSFGNPSSYRLIPGETYNASVPASSLPDRFIRDPLCEDESLGGPGPAGIAGFLGPPSNNNQICRTDLLLARDSIAASERINSYAAITIDASASLKLGVEGTFSKNELSRAGGFAFPVFGSILVPEENPGNTFGGDVLYRGRPNGPPSGEPFISLADTETWRITGWADGDIGASDWSWSANLTYSENSTVSSTRDTHVERLTNALVGLGGPDCDTVNGTPGVGDCQYFNPFGNAYLASEGDPQFNDPELVEYITPRAINFADSDLLVGTAVVRGSLFELPAGAVEVAVGYEYRDTSLSRTFNDLKLDGAFGFVSSEVPFSGSIDSHSGFFEAKAPIFEGFDLNLSGRYEDYDAYSSFNPKVGAFWTINDVLAVRASWGTSFRAPGLIQLFGTQTGTQQVNQPGFGILQPLLLTQPTPDLDPEEADVINAGLVLTPAPGLNIALDYWNIDFTGLIVLENAQDVVDDFVASGGVTNADRVTTLPGGEIVAIDVNWINASSLKTDGFDFSVNWDVDTAAIPGALSFFAGGSWTNSYDFKANANAPVVDGVGRTNDIAAGGSDFGIPEWRGNFGASWGLDGHFIQAVYRVTAGLTNDLIPDDDPRQDTSDDQRVDVLYSYSFEAGRSPITLRAGVNNLFNQLPPFQSGASFIPINAGSYDPRGRQFFLGLSVAYE